MKENNLFPVLVVVYLVNNTDNWLNISDSLGNGTIFF